MEVARDKTWRARVIRREETTRDFSGLATVASIALFVLAILLASRRVVGAMTSSLAAGPLLATAILLLFCVWCARIFELHTAVNTDNDSRPLQNRFLNWMPFASLILTTFACSFPFTRFIDWLVWSPTIAAAWAITAKVQAQRQHQAPELRVLKSAAGELSEPAEQVLQQFTRVCTADGLETIRGTVAAKFTPGQRAATVFVGFCPPFERLPEIDTEVEDGDESAEIGVIQVLHSGAQLEVRLPRPASAATQLTVAFFASEAPADES